MIRKDIPECSVFGEFTPEEQKSFFNVKGKKVLHNIDTLYYSVQVKESGEKDLISPLIRDLQMLRDLDEECRHEHLVGLFKIDDLEYKPCNFANIYRHCLSVKNEFDIFVAESIPTVNTPRIVVQIRSIALWAYGDKASVKKSFDYVRQILRLYSLRVFEVTENRLDYAFHTNAIQNAESFLTDKLLLKSLKSKLTKYQKVGNIGKDLTVEYLSLGMRKSNNIFFRAYNKSREVVEMGYKSIFIEVWYKNGLISEYDKFVLEKAYQFGSKQGFDSAVAIGKIDWYLLNGKNAQVKSYLQELRSKYLVDGSNNTHLSEELKKLLPDLTSIMNFEFQTKRKYYYVQKSAIAKLEVNENDLVGYEKLRGLFTILDNRALFLDKLTSETVCFVRDRKKPGIDIVDADYLDFWRRIRRCKLPCASDVELYKEYIRHVDTERAKKGLADKVALLSVLGDSENGKNFTCDLADSLSYFNDNDIGVILAVDANGEVFENFEFENYDILKGRKKRQYKFLSKEKAAPEAPPEEPFPNGD